MLEDNYSNADFPSKELKSLSFSVEMTMKSLPPVGKERSVATGHATAIIDASAELVAFFVDVVLQPLTSQQGGGRGGTRII